METAQIIQLAAEAGANAALDAFEKKKNAEIKERHDRRLRNTKLLLRHYRSFKSHVQNAIYESDLQEDENTADILELMWENNSTEAVVESIKRSATRTKLIVEHTETMLNAYKMMCMRSGNDTDKRHWNVIYDMYIAEEMIPKEEIAERNHIELRTVYKDVDVACKKLSTLIFGIDGIN